MHEFIALEAVPELQDQLRDEDLGRLALFLEKANVSLEPEAIGVGQAKDRLSALLNEARAGHAPIIGLGGVPVVMLGADALLRLLHVASTPITGADVLAGLSGMPPEDEPLLVINHGGPQQILSVPEPSVDR